jgi:hypothetical protein
MPSTYETLRRKFFTDKSDGIEKAERILRSGGFLIKEGMITHPEQMNVDTYTRGEMLDAIDFLVEEWDYSVNRWGDNNE